MSCCFLISHAFAASVLNRSLFIFSLLSNRQKRVAQRLWKHLVSKGHTTLGGPGDDSKYLAAFASTTHLRKNEASASIGSKVTLTKFIFGNREEILLLFLFISLALDKC